MATVLMPEDMIGPFPQTKNPFALLDEHELSEFIKREQTEYERRVRALEERRALAERRRAIEKDNEAFLRWDQLRYGCISDNCDMEKLFVAVADLGNWASRVIMSEWMEYKVWCNRTNRNYLAVDKNISDYEYHECNRAIADWMDDMREEARERECEEAEWAENDDMFVDPGFLMYDSSVIGANRKTRRSKTNNQTNDKTGHKRQTYKVSKLTKRERNRLLQKKGRDVGNSRSRTTLVETTRIIHPELDKCYFCGDNFCDNFCDNYCDYGYNNYDYSDYLDCNFEDVLLPLL